MKTITTQELSNLTQVSVRWIEAKCQTGEIKALQNEERVWLVFESELRENALIIKWLTGKDLFWEC